MRRRALLGAAALVAGCGAGDDTADRVAEALESDTTLADTALLNDALAAERRAAPRLPRSREHARLLESEIRRTGAEPQPLADAAPAPADARAASAELIALYVDVLAKLTESRLRGVLAGLLAAASEAGAEARARAGEDPAPQAFDGGRPPG